MKISEFLSKYGEGYVDLKISPYTLEKLISLSERTLEFIGAVKKEYTTFAETSFLYRFPKDSERLGDYLKNLGVQINQIPLEGIDLGIQEIDPSKPDGYYILFYLLEGVRD